MTFCKRGIAVMLMAAFLMAMSPLSASAADTTTGQTETTTIKQTTQTKSVGYKTSSGKIVTLKSSFPTNTMLNSLRVNIFTGSGTRSYRIFAQKAYKKNGYIAMHGCATCSLTTVLTGYTTKYKNYTPGKTCTILEKKILGTKAWKKNYKKSVRSQRPISLLGISKVLKKVGVKNTYVAKFEDAKAVAAIKKHLYKGKPVIIEVNSHTQKNGKFSSTYNQKWASSKHTMVLLGMTDTGKVIVADSATRKWAGNKQRIKYTTMEELIRYMIPCKATPTQYYYKNLSTCGGYILVN